MLNRDLIHPGNIAFIAVVSLVAIMVFNVVSRKFSLFNPPAKSAPSVAQYPN